VPCDIGSSEAVQRTLLWAPGNDLTDATARWMASAHKNRAVCEIGPVVLQWD